MIYPSLSTAIYVDPPAANVDYREPTGHCFTSLYTDRLISDLDQFTASTATVKLAVVTKWTVSDLRNWILNELPQLESVTDRIYLALPEGYVLWQEQYRDLIGCLDRPGMIIMTCAGPTDTWKHAIRKDYFPWMTKSWSANSVALPERLRELNTVPYDQRKLFDCLLGLNKPWRTAFYQVLQRFDLVRDNLVPYQTSPGLPAQQWWFKTESLPIELCARSDTQWPISDQVLYALIPIDDLAHGSLPPAHRNFTDVTANTLVDTYIYNLTFLSVVAESHNYPGVFFFTEKTAKPMIARRPFVMVAPAGSLQKLRDLGFQTFSPVIDESYDLINDDALRFLVVARLLKDLGTRDRDQLMQDLAPVFEHNFQRIRELGHWHMPNGMYMRELGDLGFDARYTTHNLGRCVS
jgi:hypothetical protein